MKLGVLYSGGKDSHLVLNLLKDSISALITVYPSNSFPYLYHSINLNIVKEHSKRLNLPLISLSQEELSEVEALDKAVKIAIDKYKITGIAAGAIASNYQKQRIEKIANKYNLKTYFPLWNIKIDDYFYLYEKYKIEAIITGVYAYPLDEKYLLRSYSKELAKYFNSLGINPYGEGGEFESLVYSSLVLEKINYKVEKIEGKLNSWTAYIKL